MKLSVAQSGAGQPAIKRGATDTQLPRGGAGIAACAGKRLAQHGAVTIFERRRKFGAQQLIKRNGLRQNTIINPQPQPRVAAGTNNQTIAISRQQGWPADCVIEQVDDAVPVKMAAEEIAFDTGSCIADHCADHFRHGWAVIVAATGDIQRANQSAQRIMQRGIHATDADIAAGEMLIPVDDERPVFDQAGTDTIGAFFGFAPQATFDKTGGGEMGSIASANPAFQDHAAAIGQYDAAAGPANQSEDLVQNGGRYRQQAFMFAAAIVQSVRINAKPLVALFGIEPVAEDGTAPGCGNRRHRRAAGGTHGIKNHVGVLCIASTHPVS